MALWTLATALLSACAPGMPRVYLARLPGGLFVRAGDEFPGGTHSSSVSLAAPAARRTAPWSG